MTDLVTPTDADREDAAAVRDQGVAHMKWWGWGVPGVAFHFEDKPAFAPFVLKAVGLDLHASSPLEQPDFAALDVPASIADAPLREAMGAAVGADRVADDDLDRVVHTYGKSIRDLIKVRAGRLPRVPDLVVYPADEAAVQAVVDAVVAHDAVLIPFGGGSNIAGSLEPMPGESRPVVSVDLGLLDRVLDVDEGSGLARVQAGVLGPSLEAQLNARGWTIGHFPDSFTHSSLGGWIATRSSGMQSDKYGDIADIARGMRVARPGGLLDLRATPSASTGPSVREMILGSEGRLGVITEAVVQVHRVPAKRSIHAYFFPNWRAGTKAMRQIAASDVHPAITRVSDGRETGFSLSTSKESKGFGAFAQKALFAFLQRRGWNLDEMCLSFIGYEGEPAHVAKQRRAVERIVKRNGGISVGTGPGVLYDQKKFDTPYLRDFLLDRGTAGDVSETSVPWTGLDRMHDGVIAAAEAAYESLGRKGWIMSHLSHSYHSGACLYFTFAFVMGDDPEAEYDVVKQAIQQAFIDLGGVPSHHHGIGVEHAPWLPDVLSEPGIDVLEGLFAATDPGRNLNPAKITAN
ncbi:FAD-binding oxidoreductase [Amnibacterium kyonggiense]|uniref:Alkyldihydroxyacetonephosphate synthase n=1 Tax=Amnibacterium kyonggiense TaxID=595671 RepID=A0A4R7FG83_9MICO|nr:FAD-binding oxidoreductase [Amnibacterium kyonggiense]TDS75655.1 alkyldihydroxyacetonephosphate synthase [Amnibacterium kyonggiense]